MWYIFILAYIVYIKYVYDNINHDLMNKIDLIPITKREKTVDTFKGYKRLRHVYNEFELWEIYNILSESECKTIINISEKRGFKASVVHDEHGNNIVDTDRRISKTGWLSNRIHPLVERLSRTTAVLTGLPVENQELLQVAKYQEGGMFVPHHDTCMGTIEECIKTDEGAGPRIATLLIYLNDDYIGGQTYFPTINLTIHPKRGKGILFWSCDKNGYTHPESLHQGLTVAGGMKYICTKWAHVHSFPSIHLP